MNKDVVDVRTVLEEEITEVLMKVSMMDATDAPLEEGALGLAFKRFKELVRVVSAKAEGYGLNSYASAVKLSGLAFACFLKRNLTPKEIAVAFVAWFIKKRVHVGGCSVDDLMRVDADEMSGEEFNSLMYSLDPLQQEVFLSLQHTHRAFIELVASESFKYSQAKKRWFEILDIIKSRMVEMPLDQYQWQDVIEA